MNITSTGAFNAGAGRTLTHYGDLTVSGGIFNILGTVTFAGTALQTITSTNATIYVYIQNYNGSVSPQINSTSSPQFQYLNINNTGGVNPKVTWTVHQEFTVDAGATFNGGNATHNIIGNVTNNGAITSSGTMNFIPSSAATVNLGAHFSSTGNHRFPKRFHFR